MTLNEMAGMYQAVTGEGLGFEVKSIVTGRVMKVVMKTPMGKFLLVGTDGEGLAKGDGNRYEFNDGSIIRRMELDAKVRDLMQKEAALEAELFGVQALLDTVTAELTGLAG